MKINSFKYKAGSAIFCINIVFRTFCIFILLNIYSCRSSFAQTNKIDSLKTALSKAKDDTTKVNALNALALEYKNTNPDTSFILLNQALALSKKIKWQKGKANTLRNIGVYHFNRSNYREALKYYFDALKINKELNDKKGLSATLGNIGIVYYEQGDYPNALEHYFKALEITKELGNKSGIARHLSNIGIVYYKQGDYPRALENYFKALEIAKELGDKRGIAADLGNIGNVYYDQGDYPKALEHYFKALEIAKELGDKRGIAADLGNIGNVYDEQSDKPSALEHFFKALEIAKELGNKSGISKWLGNIGALYTKLKRYPSAEEYLNKSLTVAEEIGSINSIKEDHYYLSELFVELAGSALLTNRSRRQYYNQAIYHYEKYLQAKDTLFNEEKSESIGKLEARHEFAVIEMEQERAERKHILAVKAANKRRDEVQFTGIIALLLVVVLIVSLLLFSKYKVAPGIKTGSLFIAFLLFFEFMLVWFDPSIEKFTGGDPFLKLGINAVLAIIFYFIQKYVETRCITSLPTIQKTNNHVLSFLILILVVPPLSAFVQEKDSHKNTKTLNPTKIGTNEQTNKRTNEHSNNGTIDSLKTLLNTYQTQIAILRSQNKIKEALETLKKYGDAKDNLQSHEQSQEFTRINEKHTLELQKVKQKAEEEERVKLEKEKKVRINLLKDSILLITIIFLFITLSVTGRIRMGRFSLSHSVLEAGLFVSFLLFFEFLLVFADPYIEQYTGGAPAWKFGFNVVIAVLIFPVHHFLEEKMRVRLFSAKREMVEKKERIGRIVK